VRSAERPRFADAAVYAFPRGGQTIEGPSVNLARECARLWGNLRHGVSIVSADDDWIHIKGWAWDLQTNTKVEVEDRFRRLVQRRQQGGGTQWVKPDERDLRELVNRRGAICVRNAILQVMPPDVVDEAVDQAKRTNADAAAGRLSTDPTGTVRAMARAFGAIGVTVAMIEAKLGHALTAELVDAAELAELRAIFASLRDGNTKRADHFELTPGGPAPSKGSLDVDAVKAAADQTPTPRGKAPEKAPEASKPKADPVKPKASKASKAKAAPPASPPPAAKSDDDEAPDGYDPGGEL